MASAKDSDLKPGESGSLGGASKKSEDGFTAGLQCWLIFLLSFVFLGFPLAYAIVFGAIGGMAGGFAVGWWQSKDPNSNFKIGNSDFRIMLDAQRLVELDQPQSETDERTEKVLRRRARYVSNRPYNRDRRKQSVNTWMSWRRGSRPEEGQRGDP